MKITSNNLAQGKQYFIVLMFTSDTFPRTLSTNFKNLLYCLFIVIYKLPQKLAGVASHNKSSNNETPCFTRQM